MSITLNIEQRWMAALILKRIESHVRTREWFRGIKWEATVRRQSDRTQSQSRGRVTLELPTYDMYLSILHIWLWK